MGSLINTPTLFERNPRTGKVVDQYIPRSGHFHQWTATEHLAGAEVRVTVVSGKPVRLEVVARPTLEQRTDGIELSWFKDVERAEDGPSYWLYESLDGSDFSQVPDGEWEGTAIGPGISRNPLGLEANSIVLTSLFPWRDVYTGVVLPPELGRTPMEYNDLKYWLETEPSRFGDGPLDGILWWWYETPVAKIRQRDFGHPTIRRDEHGNQEG